MAAVVPLVPASKKSTTVRPDYARVPRVVRTAFRLGSRVAPALAARLAEHVFFRPHLRSSRVPGAPATHRLRVEGLEISTYSWGGDSGPCVFLVHGWEGSAAQMAPLAWSLATSGVRVVAMDLPAHGRSGGVETSLPEAVRVLRALAREMGPVTAVVGHSFGAVAAMALADELDVERVVTLGAPASLDFVIASFASALGLGERAHQRFRERLERRLGAEMWQRLSPRLIAQRVSASALVIHDTDDAAVPCGQAKTLVDSWASGAHLMTTTGLGHYRVLRSSEVHRAIVSFLDPGGMP